MSTAENTPGETAGEQPGTPDEFSLINLRHLRAWVTVVEEGSVTAGARKLIISQPALSQQLRTLEQFLGMQLLERLPRGVQPTPFGRALLDDARVTLVAADRLSKKARGLAGFEVGMLEIATLPTLTSATLLEPIRRWHQEHAGIPIRLHEVALQSSLVEQVSMGVGDVAIGVRPARWSGPIVSLGWEQFVVILPPGDPLEIDPSPIALQDLADREWVLYGKSNGLSDYVSSACARAGFRPREAVSTTQVQAAIELATAGLGPALVPSANIPAGFEGSIRKLNPPIVWELAAFSRSVIFPPAAAFVEMVKDHVRLEQPSGAVEIGSD